LACKNEYVRISVELSHEFEPAFKLWQFQTKQSEWIIVFELNDKDFEKTIGGIEAAINNFPTRKKLIVKEAEASTLETRQ